MKSNFKRKVAVFALALPLLFTAVGCNNNSNNGNKGNESSEVQTLSVTLTEGEGYRLNGASSVRQGDTYVFSITILDGYDASELVVKNNGIALQGDKNNYFIRDVQENIVITVEGLFKESKISITKTLFRINFEKMTNEDRQKDKYLEGVNGIYRGERCEVDVDISEIDFNHKGTYIITYFLVGHTDVVNYATVEIYTLPVINNVTIDLSNTYTNIISFEDVGQVHIDFEIKDNNNHILTNSEIRYSAADKVNYFTMDYCKTLTVQNNIQYYVLMEDEELPFKVSVTDNEELKLNYSLEMGEYAYLVSENFTLPTVSLKNNSAQKAEFKYYLNNVEINPEGKTFDQVGDYSYEIKVFRNSEEVTSLNKSYTFHILNSYELTDDTDLNGPFLFYNVNTFSPYFIDCQVISTDLRARTASLYGDQFKISASFIDILKARGYNHISFTLTAEAESGDPIISMPFVSGGYDIPDFWRTYWAQNECQGTYDFDLDLTKIDHVNYPAMYLQFGFRTVNSGGYDVKAEVTLSNLRFSTEEIPVVNDDWSLRYGTGQIYATEEIGEDTVRCVVNNMSYNWEYLFFLDTQRFIQQGLTQAIVTIEGNNHMMYLFSSDDVTKDIPNLDHSINYGGGMIKLDLLETDLNIGAMTSHVRDGNQDESGQYGKAENITITIRFVAPREYTLVDQIFTQDAWDMENGTNMTFDIDNGTIGVKSSWSIYLKTAYAKSLVDAGYHTLKMRVIMQTTALYFTTGLNGIYTSYKNESNTYDIAVSLDSCKISRLQLRGNTEDATDNEAIFHGKGAAANFTISNVEITSEQDPEVLKNDARERLANMFKAEGNNWKYIRHNGYDSDKNQWGADNKTVNLKAQNSFYFTNEFFQDLKIAEYTTVTFHVKGVSTIEGKTLSFMKYVNGGNGHPSNYIDVTVDGEENDFTIDFTDLLNTLTEDDTLFFIMEDASHASLNCDIAISNFVFA